MHPMMMRITELRVLAEVLELCQVVSGAPDATATLISTNLQISREVVVETMKRLRAAGLVEQIITYPGAIVSWRPTENALLP